jgi:hypothetical protein
MHLDAIPLALLCLQLGSDSFQERQQADATLARILATDAGCVILPTLDAMTGHDDAEIVHRYRRLVEGYYDVGPYPWLDLVTDRPDFYLPPELQSYLVQARESGLYAEQWGEWREATRLYVRDLLRSGVPRNKVKTMLAAMQRREDAYHRRQEAQQQGNP